MKKGFVVHKGGKYLIYEDPKKGIENIYFKLFLDTESGMEWYSVNGITKATATESPDFTFNTCSGKIIGLELVSLNMDTDKLSATYRLQNIANKLCYYFKDKKGVSLSITLDVYDERQWSTNWEDHINYLYDPGFKYLNASDKDIKNEIIRAFADEDFTSFGVIKKWVDIKSQKIIVTVSKIFEPYMFACVNNSGMCKENPFEELQNTISAKNNKFEAYKNNCDECDLLVVFDNCNGNFALFTDEINSYEFVSLFRYVYLLDLDNGRSFSLKLRKK